MSSNTPGTPAGSPIDSNWNGVPGPGTPAGSPIDSNRNNAPGPGTPAGSPIDSNRNNAPGPGTPAGSPFSIQARENHYERHQSSHRRNQCHPDPPGRAGLGAARTAMPRLP